MKGLTKFEQALAEENERMKDCTGCDITLIRPWYKRDCTVHEFERDRQYMSSDELTEFPIRFRVTLEEEDLEVARQTLIGARAMLEGLNRSRFNEEMNSLKRVIDAMANAQELTLRIRRGN